MVERIERDPFRGTDRNGSDDVHEVCPRVVSAGVLCRTHSTEGWLKHPE